MDTTQITKSHPTDWARATAAGLLSANSIAEGVCLIMGACDTGKTSLARELASLLCKDHPVAIVDADIGQSRLGPPGTIGYVNITEPHTSLQTSTPDGIRFVGDITPVAHLLQFTAALTRCVHSVSKTASHIIVDTPGLVSGSAAVALWWNIYQILQPSTIIALQRESELTEVLNKLRPFNTKIEIIRPPHDIIARSPQQRRKYRADMFDAYFQNACEYAIKLDQVTIHTDRHILDNDYVNHIVGLRDYDGSDIAVGVIKKWNPQENSMAVRAPQVNLERLSCVVVGDAKVDIA